MKKFNSFILLLLFLSGCAQPLALLGPASTTATSGAGGNYLRGAFTSSVSLGIKKQTGKSPVEHALTYADKDDQEKKKSKCVAFLEATNSEICEAVKKNILETKKKIAGNSKIKNLIKNWILAPSKLMGRKI